MNNALTRQLETRLRREMQAAVRLATSLDRQLTHQLFKHDGVEVDRLHRELAVARRRALVAREAWQEAYVAGQPPLPPARLVGPAKGLHKKFAVVKLRAPLVIKSVSAELREIEGIATSPKTDRVGDVVDPMGGQFNLPLPLLWQHKHDSPVGRVTKAEVSPQGISIKAKLANVTEPGEVQSLVDRAWHSIKYGLVTGLSFGFQALETEPFGNGLRFSKWEMLELSLVTVPANADASITLTRAA